ncbi:hypothetical protein HK405_003531 [Cladochytrium tenue]|nr:hypothetical protein HK405_003531 [Cladochytrium tenue]
MASGGGGGGVAGGAVGVEFEASDLMDIDDPAFLESLNDEIHKIRGRLGDVLPFERFCTRLARVLDRRRPLVVPYVVLVELDNLKAPYLTSTRTDSSRVIVSTLARNASKFLLECLRSSDGKLRGQRAQEQLSLSDGLVVPAMTRKSSTAVDTSKLDFVLASSFFPGVDKLLCIKAEMHGITTLSNFAATSPERVIEFVRGLQPLQPPRGSDQTGDERSLAWFQDLNSREDIGYLRGASDLDKRPGLTGWHTPDYGSRRPSSASDVYTSTTPYGLPNFALHGLRLPDDAFAPRGEETAHMLGSGRRMSALQPQQDEKARTAALDRFKEFHKLGMDEDSVTNVAVATPAAPQAQPRQAVAATGPPPDPINQVLHELLAMFVPSLKPPLSAVLAAAGIAYADGMTSVAGRLNSEEEYIVWLVETNWDVVHQVTLADGSAAAVLEPGFRDALPQLRGAVKDMARVRDRGKGAVGRGDLVRFLRAAAPLWNLCLCVGLRNDYLRANRLLDSWVERLNSL